MNAYLNYYMNNSKNTFLSTAVFGLLQNFILIDTSENTRTYAVSISLKEPEIVQDGWPFILEGHSNDEWFFLGKVIKYPDTLDKYIHTTIELPNNIALKSHLVFTFLNQYDKGITNEELYEFNKNVFGNGY